ncbi:MAG: CRTAC1 family protein [Gammaproteobacteria bacterium]
MNIIRILLLIPILHFNLAHADFTDLTRASGLTNSNGNLLIKESWGAVSCDWNKDGHLDLVLNNHRDPMSLYMNNGDGTFADRSGLLSNPVRDTDEHGIVCADFFPDDKYLEIAVAAGGRHSNVRQYRKFFRFDEQAGRYIDIAASINFRIKNHSGRSLLIADFDGDHRLDIFESAQRKLDQAPPASASYQFLPNTNQFGLMPDKLTNNCTDPIILFGRLLDMDGDHAAEIACIGGSMPNGLFEINRNAPGQHFTDIWGQLSSEKKYGAVKDVVVADFDNDGKQDIFIARRQSQPSNAALKNGKVRATLIVKNASKTFNFAAAKDQPVTLTFGASYLELNRQIFYGTAKTTDHRFKRPWSSIQSVTLDPKDPRFMGVDSVSTQEGLYIGFDGQKWHVRLTSKDRQEFAGHFVSAQPLSDLVIGFANHRVTMKPVLLMNTGSGFVNHATLAGFTSKLDILAAEGGDFDNDGDIDLYLVLSNAPDDYPDRLYTNNGNGTFTLKQTLPAVGTGSGENLTVADYDMDGCLDIVVVNGHGVKPNSAGPVQLLAGDCNTTNNWIELDLDGLTPHGVGATVYVETGSRRFRKLQDGGARRFGQNSQRLHFGLGENIDTVDISVVWDDGQRTNYPAMPTNRIYRLGQNGSTSIVGAQPQPQPPQAFSLSVEANQQSTVKPGPVLDDSADIFWKYTVVNNGASVLNNVEIGERQKLPVLGDWITICEISSIQPGNSRSCVGSSATVSGAYKALVVARAYFDSLNSIEVLHQAFYQGVKGSSSLGNLQDNLVFSPNLGLSVLVNGQASDQPSLPVVPAARVSWLYIVSNSGDTDIENVRLRVKVKNPVESDWAEICEIGLLLPGQFASCTLAQQAVIGDHKSRIVVTGREMSGQEIKAMVKGYYRGQ